MQTKKRAKPVKFGAKEKVKKEAVVEEQKEVEEKEEVEESIDSPEEAPVENTIESEKEEEPQDEEASEEIEHTETHPKVVEKVSIDTEEPEEATISAESDTPKEEKIEKEIEPEEFFSKPPEKYENKKSMVPYFLLVSFVAFLLGLAFIYGIFYAMNSKPKSQTGTPDVKITSAPENVTPTEKPLDLSAFTISILNGTDVSGVAAKLKSELEDAGFKVGEIGNADSTDFEKTEIKAKKTVNKEFLDKLKEILKKSYELGSTSTLASGEADVVITIGSASAK